MIVSENFYYHWHPELFKNNDIFECGNYGKLLNSIDLFFQHDKYLLEVQFELFRSIYYPFKPSRFNSVFLLKNKEDALVYRKHVEVRDNKPYNRNLYTVEIIDKSKPIHIGSTSLFNQYCLKGDYKKAAACYWNSESAYLQHDNGHLEEFAQEIIVESNIKVIAQILCV